MNAELMAYLTDPNRLWAIDEAVLIGYKEAAENSAPVSIEARAPGAAMRGAGNVAVLDIMGPISHRPSVFSALFGGASVTSMRAIFRQAMADDTVKAIVLNLDTPGGTVAGIPEFAAEVLAARGRKPIIAHVDSLAASAGYYIAAMADEVVATPSGMIGSIGVIGMHADVSEALGKEGVKITVITSSKNKAEGSPYGPLSDDALSAMKRRINAAGADFEEAIGRGRGISAQHVRAKYGEGRVFNAKDALAAGMIDRIATFDEVIGGLVGRSSAAMRAVEEGHDAIIAALSEGEVSVNDIRRAKAAEEDRLRRLERF